MVCLLLSIWKRGGKGAGRHLGLPCVHVSVTARGFLRLLVATSALLLSVFQGNSNNTATVDISAGFVGLDTYMEVPAVFLTAFATFAGPVLWASHLVSFLSSETSR